jgi:asparagine synthase (glutamine-hydrolysing)
MSRTRRGRYGTTVAQAIDVVDGGVVRNPDPRIGSVVDGLLHQWFDPVRDRDFLTQMTLVDIASYLPGDILTKVDRASMSVSLEARVPLLDHPLVEFAVSLPERFKRREATGKWLLRKAFEPVLPPGVLTYPKRGFAVPLDGWFRNELGYRLDEMLGPNTRLLDHADRSSVARLVREHRSRRRDHGYYLWRLLVLDLWLTSLRRGELVKATTPDQTFLERAVVRAGAAR